MNSPKPFVKGKRGVVGVMMRGHKLLTIRRSQYVTAPGKLCLPGGTIEFGESEEQALVREMKEELAIEVTPVRCCWRSITPWGTKLAFWYAELDENAVPTQICMRSRKRFGWIDMRSCRQAMCCQVCHDSLKRGGMAKSNCQQPTSSGHAALHDRLLDSALACALS